MSVGSCLGQLATYHHSSKSMSARQPFYPARPASESQGMAQSFNQTNFMIDSSNPLHLSSPAPNQSDSMKTAFSVPGPFSSNGATSTPQAKTSGLGNVLKKKSAHALSQSVEQERKGSFNSVGFSDLANLNVRPGTAAPRSEAHRGHETALETQHGSVYQNTSRRSLGLLDPGGIVRPGTTVPQSKAPQDYPAGLDIRAPIPKPAASSTLAFFSRNGMSHLLPLLLSLDKLPVMQISLTESFKTMRIYPLPRSNRELLVELMM